MPVRIPHKQAIKLAVEQHREVLEAEERTHKFRIYIAPLLVVLLLVVALITQQLLNLLIVMVLVGSVALAMYPQPLKRLKTHFQTFYDQFSKKYEGK